MHQLVKSALKIAFERYLKFGKNYLPQNTKNGEGDKRVLFQFYVMRLKQKTKIKRNIDAVELISSLDVKIFSVFVVLSSMLFSIALNVSIARSNTKLRRLK